MDDPLPTELLADSRTPTFGSDMGGNTMISYGFQLQLRKVNAQDFDYQNYQPEDVFGDNLASNCLDSQCFAGFRASSAPEPVEGAVLGRPEVSDAGSSLDDNTIFNHVNPSLDSPCCHASRIEQNREPLNSHWLQQDRNITVSGAWTPVFDTTPLHLMRNVPDDFLQQDKPSCSSAESMLTSLDDVFYSIGYPSTFEGKKPYITL